LTPWLLIRRVRETQLIRSQSRCSKSAYLNFDATNLERAAYPSRNDRSPGLGKTGATGHGVLNPDSSPRHIPETRRYLRDFAASLATTSTARELYDRMLSLYPDRVNPGSLWGAAKASKPS
jgi:hypothetical protein